jgi:hypothetical protein
MKTNSHVFPLILLLFAVALFSCSEDEQVDSSGEVIAEAGIDRIAYLYNEVLLDGSASLEQSRKSLNFLWSIKTKPEGSSAIIPSPNLVKSSFVPDLPGIYTVVLQVNSGPSIAKDEIRVTVINGAEDSQFQLNDDELYFYNSGNPEGLRLDVLLNDSIKGDVILTFGTPDHGSLSFLENEGWFYHPAENAYDTVRFSYSVCDGETCKSANVTIILEEYPSPEHCMTEINGETVETEMGKPVVIRIFENDLACPYAGSYIASPTKGTFRVLSYSGSFKNILYIYYPPEGFKGTDQFKYKLHAGEGQYIEAICTILVK